MGVHPARFFPPRWKLLLHALGTAGFVAIGAVMAGSHNPGWRWTGIVLALLFAVVSLVLLARALRSGPTLVVDADGIVDRTTLLPTGRLGWTEIAAVRKREIGRGMGRERLLEVVLRDPAQFRARPRTWAWRVAARYRDLIKQPQVTIPASMVAGPQDAVIREIRRQRPELDVMELPPPRPGVFASLFGRTGRQQPRRRP